MAQDPTPCRSIAHIVAPAHELAESFVSSQTFCPLRPKHGPVREPAPASEVADDFAAGEDAAPPPTIQADRPKGRQDDPPAARHRGRELERHAHARPRRRTDRVRRPVPRSIVARQRSPDRSLIAGPTPRAGDTPASPNPSSRSRRSNYARFRAIASTGTKTRREMRRGMAGMASTMHRAPASGVVRLRPRYGTGR